eukprot:755467-Pyramimonas_sp.AAC.1
MAPRRMPGSPHRGQRSRLGLLMHRPPQTRPSPRHVRRAVLLERPAPAPRRADLRDSLSHVQRGPQPSGVGPPRRRGQRPSV